MGLWHRVAFSTIAFHVCWLSVGVGVKPTLSKRHNVVNCHVL